MEREKVGEGEGEGEEHQEGRERTKTSKWQSRRNKVSTRAQVTSH